MTKDKIMTPTKSQQAQKYATQKTEQDVPESYGEMKFRRVAMLFDSYDIEQAYLDGYTACEQSLWRSVEDELPSNDDNVLMYVPTTEFHIGGYEVAYYDGEDWYTSDGEHIRPSHFMYIPSLPDTNTEKK